MLKFNRSPLSDTNFLQIGFILLLLLIRKMNKIFEKNKLKAKRFFSNRQQYIFVLLSGGGANFQISKYLLTRLVCSRNHTMTIFAKT